MAIGILLCRSCLAFGFEVSEEKTEVLHQPARREEYHPSNITIGWTELKTMKNLSFLVSTISSDAEIDEENDDRLANENFQQTLQM